MAGTTMADAKAALVAALRVRAGLTGVQVDYADQGGTARRQRIFLGDIEDNDHEPVALRAGRRRREENYTLAVIVEVIGVSPAPENNERRALELAREVEECLADDPTLGRTPGVVTALVGGMDLSTSETTDGPQTRVAVRVAVKARLL